MNQNCPLSFLIDTYKSLSHTRALPHAHTRTQVVRYGKLHKYGLEAGSKPELLIALATMTNEGALVTCNGYKDSDYGVEK